MIFLFETLPFVENMFHLSVDVILLTRFQNAFRCIRSYRWAQNSTHQGRRSSASWEMFEGQGWIVDDIRCIVGVGDNHGIVMAGNTSHGSREYLSVYIRYKYIYIEQLLLYDKKTHIYQSYQLTTVVYPFVRVCMRSCTWVPLCTHVCVLVKMQSILREYF